MTKKDVNKGISCNVKNCVFNEHGCDCNLERVSISKGSGENHYCKSFISNCEKPKTEAVDINIESSEEYINYKDLIDDIEENL